jgi:hypothetical protein
VIDEDYYWAKAEEALEKADRHSVLGNYFISIALAYRLLAFSETRYRNSRLGRAHEEVASRANPPAQIA